MARLSFGDRIRVLAKHLEQNVNEFIQDVAIVAQASVIEDTPVDTGRAKANWRASNGAPITDADWSLKDQAGTDTSLRNRAVIRQKKPGQTVYITNNLDYIAALNRGKSSQAPALFVQRAVLDASAKLLQKKGGFLR